MKKIFARIINHVVVYSPPKFGVLNIICRDCRTKKVIKRDRVRSRFRGEKHILNFTAFANHFQITKFLVRIHNNMIDDPNKTDFRYTS